MARQLNRLATGGRIDRDEPVRFRFDGRDYEGYAGDTLGSALLANNVRLYGRSFKYHRPRGLMTAGSEEPNALVEVHEGAAQTPNRRVTMTEITPGLVTTSQNRWPSLRFDLASLFGLFSRFLSAGFYYKTFIWPNWKLYEWPIRHSAGLGRAGTGPGEACYDRQSRHCDVLVIGAGPAGLAAARAAAESGSDVVLVDEMPEPGGRLLSETETIDGETGDAWLKRMVEDLRGRANVAMLCRTTAIAYYDHNLVACVERVSEHLAAAPETLPRERLWRLRAGRVVLASGAIEQPMIFPNNDRPGIMLAGAARSYINRFAVKPGRRAVLYADHDEAYGTLDDLAAAGIAVAAVVDPRPAAEIGAETGNTEHLPGHAVVDCKAGLNGPANGLSSVVVAAADGEGGSSRRIACDLLCVSGGWAPAVHLFSQSGGRIEWDDDRACFMAGAAKQAVLCAGAVNGAASTDDCIREGSEAGSEARQPAPAAAPPRHKVWQPAGRAAGKGKEFVDPQGDVTVADIRLAHHEGYVSVEHLKRYTALGMGTEQGKTSNLAGHGIMAGLRASTMDRVGTTTFRPPYVPTSLGLYGGRSVGAHLKPLRRTPMDDWNGARGCGWVDAGLWRRARYYPAAGEDIESASLREVRITRRTVGVCDVSTLGRIELKGPDTAKFLNSVYTNGFAKLPVGKARYGLMLREDGILFDDGTTSRLADDHYFMTTTSGGHGHVMSWLEFHLQAVWPDYRVKLADVTDQWAAVAVAGPQSRSLLAGLLDIDISNDALPFLGVRDCAIAGVPARLFRISFSGELAYELNVPADYGEAVWQACADAAEALDGTVYGLEALDVMRIEKGHITGSELDGRTTAADVGLGRMLSTKKHFIGKGLMGRPALIDPERKALVGLVPVDRKSRLKAGAQLVAKKNSKPPVEMLGHVSSAAFSPECGHPIGLAMLKGGETRLGEKLIASDPLRGQEIEVEVTSPVFVDPEGERLHG